MKTSQIRFTTLSSRAAMLALAAGMVAAAPAHAQAPADGAAPQAGADAVGLEEIIVTAQRRRENLQEVPIAVAAVSAQALQNAGIDSSRDLPQVVPSIQFTRSGASGLFFVRGVGTTNAAVGEEGANAVYVDGVYLGDLSQTINNFNNIERIEVLKGPQGTLFGRNATGGLIHIITKEPGDKTELKGEIGYGNYETASARVYLATPVTSNLSTSIAITKLYQGEGWGSAPNAGGREAHIQDFWGVRGKTVWKPTDTLKLTLAGDYFKNKDNLGLAWKIEPGVLGGTLDANRDGLPDAGFVPVTGPAGYDTGSNDYPLTRQKNWGVSLTSEWDLGFATLTNVAAYRKTRNRSDFDVDGGPYPLIRIAFDSGSKTIQEELRLASTGNGPFSWQVGGFYLRSTAKNNSNFTGLAFTSNTIARQGIIANLETDSYAGFGEATYAITPTTKITAGARFTADRRHFVGSSFNYFLNGNVTPGGVRSVPSQTLLATPGVQDSKLSYDAWTYRVALRQEITERISVYASYNRGFKAGSYSLQSPLNDPYLPQFINAYELGFKSELFDRRLRINIAGYHYDITDYQVRSAAVASPGASLVLNAATVKVDGAELEFEAVPIEELRIFGGMSYINSRFDKFGGAGAAFQAPIVYPNVANTNAALRTTCPAALLGTRNPGVVGTGPGSGGFTTCFGDVSGNKTPNAPEFTASVGTSLTLPVGESGGNIRFSALYSYNSGYVFEADNIFKQGDFSLLNASIEYRPWEQVGFEIWGRNITDTEYAVQKLTTATGTTTALGAPATYGATVKFDF